MHDGTWLERWMPDIAARAARRPLLELGCGVCTDSVYLESQGLRVIAADLDPRRLSICTHALRQPSLLCLDLRSPLPFAGNSFPVVLASLCLHYFTWDDTQRAVQEVRRCLVDDGMLVCRVNSTNDVHFGASGYPAVDAVREGAYYQIGEGRKRFFDETSVRALFAGGWTFDSLEEQRIRRYRRPKTIWEAVLRKTAPA